MLKQNNIILFIYLYLSLLPISSFAAIDRDKQIRAVYWSKSASLEGKKLTYYTTQMLAAQKEFQSKPYSTKYIRPLGKYRFIRLDEKQWLNERSEQLLLELDGIHFSDFPLAALAAKNIKHPFIRGTTEIAQALDLGIDGDDPNLEKKLNDIAANTLAIKIDKRGALSNHLLKAAKRYLGIDLSQDLTNERPVVDLELLLNQARQENVLNLLAEDVDKLNIQLQKLLNEQVEKSYIIDELNKGSAFFSVMGYGFEILNQPEASRLASKTAESFQILSSTFSEPNPVPFAVTSGYLHAAATIASIFRDTRDVKHDALMSALQNLFEQLIDFRHEMRLNFVRLNNKLDDIYSSIDQNLRNIIRSDEALHNSLDTIKDMASSLAKIAAQGLTHDRMVSYLELSNRCTNDSLWISEDITEEQFKKCIVDILSFSTQPPPVDITSTATPFDLALAESYFGEHYLLMLAIEFARSNGNIDSPSLSKTDPIAWIAGSGLFIRLIDKWPIFSRDIVEIGAFESLLDIGKTIDSAYRNLAIREDKGNRAIIRKDLYERVKTKYINDLLIALPALDELIREHAEFMKFTPGLGAEQDLYIDLDDTITFCNNATQAVGSITRRSYDNVYNNDDTPAVKDLVRPLPAEGFTSQNPSRIHITDSTYKIIPPTVRMYQRLGVGKVKLCISSFNIRNIFTHSPTYTVKMTGKRKKNGEPYTDIDAETVVRVFLIQKSPNEALTISEPVKELKFQHQMRFPIHAWQFFMCKHHDRHSCGHLKHPDRQRPYLLEFFWQKTGLSYPGWGGGVSGASVNEQIVTYQPNPNEKANKTLDIVTSIVKTEIKYSESVLLKKISTNTPEALNELNRTTFGIRSITQLGVPEIHPLYDALVNATSQVPSANELGSRMVKNALSVSDAKEVAEKSLDNVLTLVETAQLADNDKKHHYIIHKTLKSILNSRVKWEASNDSKGGFINSICKWTGLLCEE